MLTYSYYYKFIFDILKVFFVGNSDWKSLDSKIIADVVKTAGGGVPGSFCLDWFGVQIKIP